MNPDRRGSRALLFLFAVLAVAAGANALAFAATTANWIPTADNWYFLDRIVYPYAHGQFDPGMLLVKRGVFDHSQPLRRLLLLANYEWFDLDFRVEAVFAVLIGIANVALLGFCMRRELRVGSLLARFSFVALVAVYFSLSAPVVFTWSLLTLGFSNQSFLLLWLLAAWAVLERPNPPRIALLAAATFALGLVSDDTAIVAVIAGAMASLIHADHRRVKRAALSQVAATLAGIAVYFAFYHAFAPAMPAASGGRIASLAGLIPPLGDAWKLGAVPLVSGLVHKAMLRSWFGGSADAVIFLLALGFVLAHAWFWKQAFTGARNRTAFMATVFMLLFYGLVAGIVVGRVSEFGVDYLWQPRYAIVYRWHVVALLMMLVAQCPSAERSGFRLRLATMLVIGLLALQAPICIEAWRSAKYIRNVETSMATQVLEMARSPSARPVGACSRQLTVCTFGDARRRRLIAFLRDQRLSAFSDDVRARNGYRGK